MTSFVGDKPSFFVLMNTVKLFGRYAGLKMNHEKTEIFPLGSKMLHPQEFGVEEIKNVVKIFGVYFTNDHALFAKRNFESCWKIGQRISAGMELERPHINRQNTSN